jgi:hypothetical protein
MEISTMEIKDAINQYESARKAIGDFFEIDIYNDVQILLDCRWYDYDEQHDSVSFDQNEERYGFEVYGTSRWEKDGYVLFVGDDGCGNRDHYLFKKDNYELDEDEE